VKWVAALTISGQKDPQRTPPRPSGPLLEARFSPY